MTRSDDGAPRLEGCVPWPPEVARRYRDLACWRGEPLDRLLRASAERSPDEIAVVCGERRVSYRALDDRVDRLAAALFARGLGARDRIVVQLPNVLEFIEVCFALFRLGAIPVMALPGHRAAEISYFCRHTGAAAYVCPDAFGGFDYRELARTVRAAAGGTLRQVIVAGDAREFVPLGALDEAPRDLPPVDAREVALLQLSGGSTGDPKLIPRTHDDYLYSVRASVPISGMDAKSVYLVALPAAHNFPLSSPGILGTLLCGGRVVMSRQPHPDSVFPLFDRESVTITAVVPPLARLWSAAARLRRCRFPSLRVLQVGGAKLDPRWARELVSELGCTLQQVFGMAEGLVSYTRLGDPLERILETQGLPSSEYDEVRIVDDQDQDLPDGTTGHLLTRGPYTIRGYYKAAEHNRQAFTADGFYRTGDLVRRRPDGYLVVEGRAKEQINRGGEKIAAVEIEEHLLSHPGVREAAVLGAPDLILGERVCAFVVAATDQQLSPSRLIHHLRERGLAVFKLPDRFELVDQLPKTSVGKTDKQALLRLVATAAHRSTDKAAAAAPTPSDSSA